jgi:dienelactone hydrolase
LIVRDFCTVSVTRFCQLTSKQLAKLHITFGWKESRDVLAAVSFLHHVDPTARVGIIGSSLGGVAALLATPPLKVDALVLEKFIRPLKSQPATAWKITLAASAES